MTQTSQRRLLLVAITCLALVVTPRGAEAGPWVHPFGHGYVKLGLSYFTAESSFQQGVPVGLSYDAFTTNVYAEVGLPARLQLIVDVPYVVATNTSDTAAEYHNHTFGDARVELDYGLPVAFPLAVGVEVKIPLYGQVADMGSSGLIDVDGRPWPTTLFPDVGDDNVDITPKVMFGYSLGVPVWFTAELGYRARLNGFADGIYTALSVGGFVWPNHIAVGVYSSAVINVQEDRDPAVMATREFVFLQGYVLLTAAPWQPDLGLTLGVGRIVHAENTNTGTDFSVGVSYRY